jgi:hypothetical protein
MIENSSVALSKEKIDTHRRRSRTTHITSQIEICVIGQIDRRVLIRRGVKIQDQAMIDRQRIFHCHVNTSWKTIFTYASE